MIPKKPAPDLIRGVQRFSEKVMLHEQHTDGTSFALSQINANPKRRGVPWRLSKGAVMHATDPFRRLYDANHARIHRLLVRIVGPQDADDLAQIVFAKAAKALPD